VLAAGTAASACGDPAHGEQLFGRCEACHALAYDRVGPRHCGLFGRRAGSAQGYEYSAAMKRSGIVWNERSLDRFLAAPTAVIPGTTMTYAGVPDRDQRVALIAYMREESAAKKCR
jgi:cytochrome c